MTSIGSPADLASNGTIAQEAALGALGAVAMQAASQVVGDV